MGGLVIFFATWFPWLLGVVPIVYEFFMRNEGETMRALARIYLPPSIVYLATLGIKLFFPSPRPFASLDIPPLVVGDNPYGSFPSSHAAFFAALGMTMYFCNPKLGKWFIAGAVLIGVARMAAGLHWPTDILAGLGLGCALGWATEKVLLVIWKKQNPQC